MKQKYSYTVYNEWAKIRKSDNSQYLFAIFNNL